MDSFRCFHKNSEIPFKTDLKPSESSPWIFFFYGFHQKFLQDFSEISRGTRSEIPKVVSSDYYPGISINSYRHAFTKSYSHSFLQGFLEGFHYKHPQICLHDFSRVSSRKSCRNLSSNFSRSTFVYISIPSKNLSTLTPKIFPHLFFIKFTLKILQKLFFQEFP